MRSLTLLVATLLLGWSATARAGHRDHHYRETGYGPPAGETMIVYARVTDVRPLYETVRTEEPIRECYESTAYDQPTPRRAGMGTVGSTIAGGVIGGVIGDRFGGGEGRDAMRLFGALVGAAIGHDAAARRQAYAAPAYDRGYPVTECMTRYEPRFEQRTVGYEVTYRYEGRDYRTRMDSPPGERLPIEVSVRPAY